MIILVNKKYYINVIKLFLNYKLYSSILYLLHLKKCNKLTHYIDVNKRYIYFYFPYNKFTKFG